MILRALLPALLPALILSWAMAPAVAEENGAVVLTIDGNLAGAAAIDLSIAQLEALGTREIKTTTPWHDGIVTFEGVPLARLMQHVKASGSRVAVLALNNYRAEIPLSDFSRFDVILATKKNGKHMQVADKGPLFIVYPYDSDPELKSEVYYSRSAWQVRRMTIE